MLNTQYIFPKQGEVMIDNKAALTAASLGATWRTRYYAVRAKRHLEENQQGRLKFKYCQTKEMVADALTKLATANVIQVLVNAMGGHLPNRTMAHRTSVTPGKANRGDITGDGPMQNQCGSSKFWKNNIYKFYIYFGYMARNYHMVYSHDDRVGSCNTPTNSDHAMQSVASRSISRAMIWLTATILLSILREWVRSKCRKVKNSRTYR